VLRIDCVLAFLSVLLSQLVSPLPDITVSASDDAKCLYDAGIDAQVGCSSKDRNVPVLHVGEQDTPTEATEQHRNPPSYVSDSNKRRKSANLLRPEVTPGLGDPFKVGNAIGCSSGARRKSSTQSMCLKINDQGLEHDFHEDQIPCVKLRKDSGWPAPKSPSPEEPASRKSSNVLPPPLMQTHGQLNKGMII
jgi:hypothetical protein